MRIVHIIRIACLAALVGAARPAVAPAADAPELLRGAGSPMFTADVSVSVDSLARPAVSVTIALPYSELSWARASDGYTASASFMVELEPAGSDRLYGGTWERRLKFASYDMTRSPRSELSESRSFDVPPGRYRVRVRVRDEHSEQESVAQDKLELEDLARTPLGFTDLQLGTRDSTGRFVLVPARVFGFDAARLVARVTVFDHRPGAWPRHAIVHHRILDEGGEVVAQGDTVLVATAPVQSFVVAPAISDLFIGTYTLELDRTEGKAHWRTTRRFEVEESGPPRGKAYTALLEALGYIASSSEVEALRNLPADKQEAAWDDFWRRRDPTPETARNEYEIEFFRRLRYADQHFQGFGYGWRSDMGRIYVRYGPPDQVEQHPATSTTSAAELWYYNQPSRRFVFVDREGFGRFTLVQPSGE